MKRNGQKVKVAYKGYLEDGTLFDECKPEEAFTFVMGTSSVIPGFEKAVGSMEVGDTITVDIPPEEAYGFYQEDAIQRIPTYFFGNKREIPVGEMISLTSPKTQRPAIVKVLGVEDGIVSLDFNHELAGKTLIYEIRLLDVEGESAE